MGWTRRAPRWKRTALALLLAETVALFWAYYAFNVGDRLRSLEQAPAVGGLMAQGLSSVQAILPSSVRGSLAGLLGVFGLRAGLGMVSAARQILGAGLLASSGSAVVAPGYFAVRRLLRRDRPGRVTRSTLGTGRPSRVAASPVSGRGAPG